MKHYSIYVYILTQVLSCVYFAFYGGKEVLGSSIVAYLSFSLGKLLRPSHREICFGVLFTINKWKTKSLAARVHPDVFHHPSRAWM